jgi:hypothetical protein
MTTPNEERAGHTPDLLAAAAKGLDALLGVLPLDRTIPEQEAIDALRAALAKARGDP